MVVIGALAGTWANTDPGCQLRCRGERGSGGANLGENLLRRLGADPRHFDQAHHRSLLLLHLCRRELVPLLDLAVPQLDAIQMLLNLRSCR